MFKLRSKRSSESERFPRLYVSRSGQSPPPRKKSCSCEADPSLGNEQKCFALICSNCKRNSQNNTLFAPFIMSTTIQTAPTSTNSFKTASSLKTKRHAVASVTLGQKGQSDPHEARYWTQKFGLGGYNYGTTKRKYAQPRELTLTPMTSAVVHQVIFGPALVTKNPPLAVISGPRVSLYGTATSSAFTRAMAKSSPTIGKIDPDRQIQTGGHRAFCGSFRNDGRLLAVGTEFGEVKICDVTVRATLGTFVAGRLPVRSVEWFRNGQHILAGGDDGTARIWNLSATERSKPILSLTGHGDVIRCMALWENKGSASEWKQLAFTGSYDHSIRVWNVQDVEGSSTDGDRCLSVLSHGAPVEAVCLMASEDPSIPVWLLSAGGTSIKIWNPITGQCHSTVPTQHRKTITSLQSAVRADFQDDAATTKVFSTRILSSSLDGLLQVHSWDATSGMMDHLYSTKVGDSVTALCMDVTGDRIAIGTVSGDVLLKVRGPSINSKKRTRDPMAGTYSFFQRGMNAEPSEGDYTITSEGKKRKLRSFDQALKGFRYSDALDDALATRRPRDVVAVLEELGKRRGLTAALANRDEELLEPILSFTIRYINRPHFASLLIGIAHKLIDIYGDVTGQSETIDELFANLKANVGTECRAQKSLLRLVGHIDALMTSSDLV